MAIPNVSAASYDTSLTLRTLGGFVLAHPEATGGVTVFGPSKPLALITYLACIPGRTARREHLIDLLWADLDPDAAAHAFRQTLWFIRQRCGPGFLKASDGTVALAASPAVDRNAFLQAVEEQQLERALKLYAGDFLPNYAAPGGADFEHWADRERERLRTLFSGVAAALARHHMGRGRHREAIALARRLVDGNLLDEASWRLLLETHVAAGDSIGAAAEADSLTSLLMRESRQPEPATRAIIARAQGDAGPTGGESNAGALLVSELIGREEEFAAIVAAWEQVRANAFRHIHISGAAGLGKTRLLHEWHNRLRAQSAQCLLIRANPGERQVSGAFLADVVAALAALPGAMGVSAGVAGTLVTLNPALTARYRNATADASTGEEALRRRILALAELAASVAEEAPLALLLDDIHWADAQSQRVLSAAMSRVTDRHVLLVTSARPTPDGALRVGETRHLQLHPLTVDQIGELLAAVAPVPVTPWGLSLATRLAAAAHGVPLLLLETLQLAIDHEAIKVDEQGWSCPDASRLDRLLADGGALRARIGELDRGQQWLLLSLSLAGSPLSIETLSVLTGRPETATEPDLHHLERKGLVKREGTEWAPGHDLLADLSIDTAAPDAVTACHAALGRCFEHHVTNHGMLQRSARHYAAANDDIRLAGVFARLVRLGNAGNAPGKPSQLAAAVLGLPENSARVRKLVSALPLTARFSRSNVRWAAVATFMLVGVTTAVAAAYIREPRSPTILVAMRSNSDSTYTALGHPLRPDQLATDHPVSVENAGGIPRLRFRLRGSTVLIRQPLGPLFATVRDFPSTGQDIVLLDGRRSQQIMPAPGDDIVFGFSPDGKYLLVYTDRWNQRSLGDLAIYDLESRTLRRLTSGDDTRDNGAAWSPEGTRIAFSRTHYRRNSPAELCLISFDGQGLSCAIVPGYSLIEVRGWIEGNSVLLNALDSSGTWKVGRLDLGTWQFERLYDGQVEGPVVNDWYLCRCRREPGERQTLAVRRIGDAARKMEVVDESGFVGRLTLMEGVQILDDSHYLSSIEIAGPVSDTVPDGEGAIHLEALGRDARFRSVTIPPTVLRWESSDTSIAVVTPAGRLLPRQAGTVTVSVSAGGWRSATRTLIIHPYGTVPQWAESWNAGWTQRWQRIGEPWPAVMGNRLQQNGDSTHESGVFSFDNWPAARGLGVELDLITPIDSSQWQSIWVGFWPISDTAAMRRWDKRSTTAPRAAGDLERACGFAYPVGEGTALRRFGGLSAGAATTFVAAPDTLATGRIWRISVQVLPDGRCTARLGDSAPITSDGRLPLDRPLHLWIQGQSHQTSIQVGEVRIWTGVDEAFTRQITRP